jgi:hypothetical protein
MEKSGMAKHDGTSPESSPLRPHGARGHGRRITPAGLRPCLRRLLLGIGLLAAPASAWSQVPVLNSDPSASAVIFLDFDGHAEPRTTHTCPPPLGAPEGWPTDVTVTDISGLVDPADVRAIWEAVAEDFAPFFVNVTTDPARQPAPGADTGTAVRVALGDVSLSGAQGYAPPGCASDPLADPVYLNPRVPNVAFVELDPRSAFAPRTIAKRVSHEAGHIYGLGHHVAPPAPRDDWIMAPERASSSSTRHIWRVGDNQFNVRQDDIAQLARLLSLRPDGASPANLRTLPRDLLRPRPPRLWAHNTLATAGDVDEFAFEVTGSGQVTFNLLGGLWADPRAPQAVQGVEANYRPTFQIRDRNGQAALVCPQGTVLTLTASTLSTISPSCGWPHLPPSLWVGGIYRMRVTRATNDVFPGNIGRYTVLIDGPIRALTSRPSIEP